MLARPLAWIRSHWWLALLSLTCTALLAGGLMLVLLRTPEQPDSSQPPVPPPHPVIQVSAEFAGASAEEVERQVTIPLERILAGMPGLKSIFSRSLLSLACLDLEFDAGTGFDKARQEVVDRLNKVAGLPPGVEPLLTPSRRFSDELLRYTLSSPRNALGQAIYTPYDLRALQDYILEREFRRVPGLTFVVSAGGTVKRYEIHPDLDRLKRYGINLAQLQAAIARSNANPGGDFLIQGRACPEIRRLNLLGGGTDPMVKALALKSSLEAAKYLRAEEARHVRELRNIVIITVNNVPVRVDDLVEGGPLADRDAPSSRGVVVGHYPRLDRVSLDKAAGPGEKDWVRNEDAILGILLARKDADRVAQAARVRARIQEINSTAGQILPGVQVVPYPGSAAAQDRIVIYGEYPANASLQRLSESVRSARKLLGRFPEIGAILSQVGQSEFGGDPRPANSAELLVALKSTNVWPIPAGQEQRRTLPQLVAEIHRELRRKLPGIDWTCAPDRGAWPGPLPLADGEHLVKVIGPDLAKLTELAERVKVRLGALKGVADACVFRTVGGSKLQFRVDPARCKRWGIPVAEVNNLLDLALRGKAITQVIEGEKTYDVSLHLPWPRRDDPASIRDVPLDESTRPGADNGKGRAPGADPVRLSKPLPRLRLGDLLAPVGDDGRPNPKDSFLRLSWSVIYREQGQRLLAVKFRVDGRSMADVLAEAQRATADLFHGPYRVEWGQP